MQRLIIRWDQFPPEPWAGGIATLGNFDGVHRGHAELIRRARQLAGDSGQVLVISFDPHPMKLLQPERFQLPISSLAERAHWLEKLGVDAFIVLQTTVELLSLDAPAFVETILFQQLQVRGLVEGFNFRFGRARSGDNDLLASECQTKGYPFEVVGPVQDADPSFGPISTSRVREAIKLGKIELAEQLLGHPFASTGKVVQGARRGRTIGIPTANLEVTDTFLPAAGVYAGRCQVDGRNYLAAVNLGPNPTFGENQRKLEVHLLDYVGGPDDLYGRNLRLEWQQFIRPVQTFSGVESLLAQLKQDIQQIRCVGRLA